MNQLGRLLSAITWLLVAGSLVIITGGLLGRPLLFAAVPTGSMVPALNPGDLIVVLPSWAASAPGLGDVVVFQTPPDRNWIVHRITDGNRTDGFVTRGDANPIADWRRVYPRDIAGVVPQWHGRPLRLPRLGSLRQDSGPLSSPTVAALALVVGVVLLVSDVKTQVRLPHLRHRRSQPTRPEGILAIYLGLAGTALLTTLIPAWALSSQQHIRYEVVAQRPANVSKVGQYILGEPHQEDVVIENLSPLPLLVVFSADDPYLTYEPWSALISGKQKRTFAVTVANRNLGEHKAVLRTGVFLPLLPISALAGLARISIPLAAMATASVPAFVVLTFALFDVRSRAALARLRARFLVKFIDRN